MTDPTLAALKAAIEQLGRSPGYETGSTRTPYLRGYHEALYDVLRVLDAQAGETGWQPIETAPKDGTAILLWREHTSIVQGSWNTGGAFLMPHWMTPTNLFNPTHWMPLPEPPR